jgi:hypothetical protein
VSISVGEAVVAALVVGWYVGMSVVPSDTVVAAEVGTGTLSRVGLIRDSVVPVEATVKVTGQMVVLTAIVLVTTEMLSAGQFVTVGAHEVTVIS